MGTSKGPREMLGINFRKAAGPDLIKGTRFTIEPEEAVSDSLTSGRVMVSACASTARGRSGRKAGYREILARYFPGTAVTPG